MNQDQCVRYKSQFLVRFPRIYRFRISKANIRPQNGCCFREMERTIGALRRSRLPSMIGLLTGLLLIIYNLSRICAVNFGPQNVADGLSGVKTFSN
jgi:hypothetical protein